MALKFVLSLKEIFLFFIFYIFIFLFIFFSIFNFQFFLLLCLIFNSFFRELKTRQPYHTYCYQKQQLTEMCQTLSYLGFFLLECDLFQSEFGSFQSELVLLKLWTRVRTLLWKLSHFGFFQLKSAFLNKSSFQNQFDSSRNKHKWSHQLLWLNFSMILAGLFD